MIHDLIQCSIFFPCALNEIMAQQAELKNSSENQAFY